ncbi:hypothetical protein ECE50_029520 [Chitinophaga sp. Mgbs1]|uniref:Uncharacterized protein n=1 Tax=Chitinophaga solisilvae TaxID=1233460 RepID=A0A9Q5DDN4_9BACT|nr:hypothetical protein [Chitinophaga solisilvae]
MKETGSVFNRKVLTAATVRDKKFKRVIALYEEELLFIGDCCTRFSQFRHFKAWLNDAAITVNFGGKKNPDYYKALLLHNPYICQMSALPWDEIDFRAYDAVICVTHDDQPLLDFLHNKYGSTPDEMNTDVYIVPVSQALREQVDMSQPGEIYISREEQQWADEWLLAGGYQPGEELFIMVDSSSTREKILNTIVYFDVLKQLLGRPNTRFLVFDEQNKGKRQFYREWVGEEGISRMIFSEGRSLRDNLCLIGSSFTRMVFGPCTGLLHCASGIFNHYVDKGLPPEKIPLLITYTGQYSIENRNANYWWGNCPLINCLLLKEVHGRKKLLQLSDLSATEKEQRDTLACSEYTTAMLMKYINRKLNPARQQLTLPAAARVLLLFEEELQLLGDSCQRFHQLAYLREYLQCAPLTVNFPPMKNQRFYQALLQHNPHIAAVTSEEKEDIRFEDYDLIITASCQEDKLKTWLDNKYGAQLPPVYSMSGYLLKPVAGQVVAFPPLEEMSDYADNARPGELYITPEERQWADNWLVSKGMQPHERLFVIVDTAAARSKLLDFKIYFELLKGLLDTPDVRILIFDEKKQGKRDLYKPWLGTEKMQRMIFAEGHTLREDLCLTGSSFTRLVLGPCTGLMHGASAIFNHYLATGTDKKDIPSIIVYTGMSGDESYEAEHWWGTSPLVSCLLLKERDGNKKIMQLHQLATAERKSAGTLPCNAYTADMLLEFIGSRFSRAGETFGSIAAHTEAADFNDLRKVLVLYEEKTTLLGDSCIKSDKFRYFKSFLQAEEIHINFTNRQNQKFYEGLLQNNPYLQSVTSLPWEAIPFHEFDAVICIAYNEDRFLEFLHQRYGEAIAAGRMKLPVFSMSRHILRPEEDGVYIFPENAALFEYMKTPRLGELYISKEERAWADQWLESQGMEKDEQLFIMLDSSAVRSKLLPMDVFFDLLKQVLQADRIKVLIFDEQGIGKEAFYREWLGDDAMKKLIFSSRLTLRQDLCLIGSGYTRTVFGPCTGLMHCASGIFNHYLANGMDPAKKPLLLVYTGWYGKERYDINLWWENAPLVNCLLLKERNNIREIVLLSELNAAEKQAEDNLPCTDYTAEMLKGFLAERFGILVPQLTE